MTNANVVKAARHIEVWLNETSMGQGSGVAEPPKRKSVSASLVGIDSDIDLAVIKIDRTRLAQQPFADSDLLPRDRLYLP